ncbi:calcium-binding protein [Pararhizobium gei]|uniref:calcium-binding protein n=1 Tax=Pararhizobium gei TaxID=1395951 RepID=UPI0023DB520C|nr:calcium-binding protein [Rhizobium gei]
MARISYGDLGFGADMLSPLVGGLTAFDRSSWSSGSIKLYDDAKNYVEFTGSGLKVATSNGGITDITAGTVTGMKLVVGGVSFMTVTGASMPAAGLGDALFAGNDAAFLTLLLAGADVVVGTRHNDVLLGLDGKDTLEGRAGDDVLVGGAGADRLLGGEGSDIAAYVFATEGVLANLADATANIGDAKGDTYASIEGIIGSDHADTLVGDAKSNVLSGGAGSDYLVGGGGKDTFFGGSGNDVMAGSAGADRFSGDDGLDQVSYAKSTKAIVAYLSKTSLNTNDAKGDVFSSVEGLAGSIYDDKLSGNGGTNILYGDFGNDELHGGAGSDLLTGHVGADDLYGGSGADLFAFSNLWDSNTSALGRDTIYDFSASAGDSIDLSAIDANYQLAGEQAFRFIGTAGFSGVSGQLRYEKKASDTYIYADVNGDRKADFAIHLDDALNLSKDYFFL